ncbi:MAG: helix-turn-helix transcriptional regulator [Gemmatimonadota bacterium]
MSDSPDIARIAALIGDPTRATVLTALLGGRALTATELSRFAGVTKQTTSSHLSRLVGAKLISVESQGRHRYFRLADADVGEVLENLMGVAQRVGAVRTLVNPVDPVLRKARVCYDHLAGELGVLVLDSMKQRSLVKPDGKDLTLTEPGGRFCEAMGIDIRSLQHRRRPLCRACLDWSVRRHHLAGAVGAAILTRCLSLGWGRRARGSRALVFSALGEKAFRDRFVLR